MEYTSHEMYKQQLRTQLPEGSSFSPENLTHLILTVCEFLVEINRQCPAPHGQLEPLMEKQIKAELYEVIRASLAEMPSEETQHRPTAEQTAVVSSWAIYGAAVQWSQQEQLEPAREFAQQVLPLILAFLQPSTKLATSVAAS